jgi:hypothetical protein
VGTADGLVAVFQKWHDDGVHEVPAHSNRTIVGQLFGWNGVSWCCEGCSVAAKQSGTPCFWTAAVAQAIADAKAGRHGLTWVPRNGVIRKGDFSTFDWGGHGNSSDFHISVVKDPGTQTKFRTLGCNENDAVTDQWRDRTFVQGFIRPATPTPAHRFTEDHMPTVRIPEPGVDSPKTPDGKPYEKGTVSTVPGTKGLIQVCADGWPAGAPVVRVAIGSGRPDGNWKGKIVDKIGIANFPANWPYDHSTPFKAGLDEQASVVNFGPGDVTLSAIPG